REDRRVGANPERERHDNDRREAWTLPQHARAVPDVLPERIHPQSLSKTVDDDRTVTVASAASRRHVFVRRTGGGGGWSALRMSRADRPVGALDGGGLLAIEGLRLVAQVLDFLGRVLRLRGPICRLDRVGAGIARDAEDRVRIERRGSRLGLAPAAGV